VATPRGWWQSGCSDSKAERKSVKQQVTIYTHPVEEYIQEQEYTFEFNIFVTYTSTFALQDQLSK
jgi:hypothetical protein